jgi:hypothetical protein
MTAVVTATPEVVDVLLLELVLLDPAPPPPQATNNKANRIDEIFMASNLLADTNGVVINELNQICVFSIHRQHLK